MSADTKLRWGYTLADLQRLARQATLGVGARAATFHDMYDTAYSAIAEHLYATDQEPSETSLVSKGRGAIIAEIRAAQRERGQASNTSRRDDRQSPSFAVYWDWAARNTPSPEQLVVERVAADQILAALTPAQSAAVHALATCADYRAAAESMSTRYGTFTGNLSDGRRRFLRLWHEGETPSGIWQRDQPGGEGSKSARRAMRNLRGRTGKRHQRPPSPDLVPVDLGVRCGSLTVLEARARGAAKILCRCECGTEREFLISNLRRRITQSCGCPKGRAAATERNRAKAALVPGGVSDRRAT